MVGFAFAFPAKQETAGRSRFSSKATVSAPEVRTSASASEQQPRREVDQVQTTLVVLSSTVVSPLALTVK